MTDSPNGTSATAPSLSRDNGIEAQGLVREFKGEIRAVDGIDFEVRPGEIYGCRGPNGAGKSTTVHMLTTLLPATAGTGRKVATYSGGMKRRLDLALALLHGPRVLFLDEPTTGLDIQSRTALWDEVAHLSRDEGVTVFLTTQYLEEADQLADRIGIIDRGKIAAEGTPAALKAEIGRPTVEVTPADEGERTRAAELLGPFGELVPASPNGAAVRLSDGSEELANIIRAFDQGGVGVANLELHAPSLNDVFLAKTGRSLEGAQAEAAQESDTGEQPVLEGAPA